MRPSALVVIVAALLSILTVPDRHCCVWAQEKPNTPAKSDTSGSHDAADRQALVSPHELFGRFIGKWDVSYQTYDKDGNVRPNRGQVTYGWILDGQAVQETWTSDSHLKDPKPFGTSIIFYDSKRQHWTEVWIYPAQGMTTIVNGGEENGRIVLSGHDEDGAILRWSFNDIKADSFVWRGELSKDEGKTWQLQGENQIHRHRE